MSEPNWSGTVWPRTWGWATPKADAKEKKMDPVAAPACRISARHEVINRALEGCHYSTVSPSPPTPAHFQSPWYCKACSRTVMVPSDWPKAGFYQRLGEIGWEVASPVEGRFLIKPSWHPNVIDWMQPARKMRRVVEAIVRGGWAMEEVFSDKDKDLWSLVLDEVVGDPWRKPGKKLCLDNRTAIEAFTLANLIDESDDTTDCLILGDMLDDAGFEQSDVIDHLRDPRIDIHLPGCWAVDVVLGLDRS